MKICYTLLAVLFLTQSTGCSTIFSGSRQKITIYSEQDSVNVTINDTDIGYAPVQVKLKRKKKYRILFEKEGHESQQVALERKFNYLMLMNIVWAHPVLWAITGGIDILTGAQWRQTPRRIIINLQPKFDKI